MSSKLKDDVIQLANCFNITLNWDRDPEESYQWDGIDIACLNQSYSNIIHDIAHWVMSSANRRLLPDFGLGIGPDSAIETELAIMPHFADLEERQASALGILIESEFGMDWRHTAMYHSWSPIFDYQELRFEWTHLKTNEKIKFYSHVLGSMFRGV